MNVSPLLFAQKYSLLCEMVVRAAYEPMPEQKLEALWAEIKTLQKFVDEHYAILRANHHKDSVDAIMANAREKGSKLMKYLIDQTKEAA